MPNNIQTEFITLEVSKCPKTIILVPASFSKKKKQERVQRYYDDTGKMRIDTIGEYDAINLKY